MSASPRARIQAIGGLMRVDQITAEVTAAFKGAGVRSILLKGPSIGNWLYDRRGERLYSDSDLLVGPEEHEAAQKVLRSLGFAAVPVDPLHKSIEAGLEWTRPGSSSVDLHHTLNAVGTDPSLVWSELCQHTQSMAVGGIDVEVLAPHACALHIALHLLHHGGQDPKSAEDLRRAASRLDRGVWEKVVALARRINAVEELRASLAILGETSHLVPLLGERSDPSVRLAILREAKTTHDRSYALTLDELSRLPLRRRALFILRRIFPSPTYVRDWSNRVSNGKWGLIRSYTCRLFFMVRHLRSARGVIRRVKLLTRNQHHSRP